MQYVPPAYHGAINYGELTALGISPDAVLDFSVNSNPYGPSPRVQAAMKAVSLDRYPDRDCLELRQLLSARLAVSLDQIVVGNGTAEVMWLLACALLQPGQRVLIIGPTFGEYERVARLRGAMVRYWLAEPPSFALDYEAIAATLNDYQPNMLFLCHPNNPTGQSFDLGQLDRWAADYPKTLFVVDEAYLDFLAEPRTALELNHPNLIILHSLTKNYALAGLRLGYAVSRNHDLIAAIAHMRPAWNVSGPAQAAGVAAIQDEAYLATCLQNLRSATHTFRAELTALGYPPAPSDTHYFLVEVGDAPRFRQQLLKHRLLVRDCTSFGLPTYIRLATRIPMENTRLIEVIQLKPRR